MGEIKSFKERGREKEGDTINMFLYKMLFTREKGESNSTEC